MAPKPGQLKSQCCYRCIYWRMFNELGWEHVTVEKRQGRCSAHGINTSRSGYCVKFEENSVRAAIARMTKSGDGEKRAERS